MSVCGVVPVAAIVPTFPSIVHIPALQMDYYCRVVYPFGIWEENKMVHTSKYE